MAVVYFTTIPCEPNTTTMTQRYFDDICLVLTKLSILGFESFRTFLCVLGFCVLRIVGKYTSRHLFGTMDSNNSPSRKHTINIKKIHFLQEIR